MFIFSEKCECRPIIVTASGRVQVESQVSYKHPKLQAVVSLLLGLSTQNYPQKLELPFDLSALG